MKNYHLKNGRKNSKSIQEPWESSFIATRFLLFELIIILNVEMY